MTTPPLIAVLPLHNSERPDPRIGYAYLDSIANAGGRPVMVRPEELSPPESSPFRGVLAPGGSDLDPALYGEAENGAVGPFDRARDEAILDVIRRTVAADLPLFCICFGAQALNVALGGTLYQDLPAQYPGALPHRQQEPGHLPAHELALTPGGLLHRITGRERIGVNSFHHQSIHRLGSGLVVDAVADDGVIEAVALPEKRFVLGAQFHPELMAATDATAGMLFRAFVDRCRS